MSIVVKSTIPLENHAIFAQSRPLQRLVFCRMPTHFEFGLTETGRATEGYNMSPCAMPMRIMNLNHKKTMTIKKKQTYKQIADRYGLSPASINKMKTNGIDIHSDEGLHD